MKKLQPFIVIIFLLSFSLKLYARTPQNPLLHDEAVYMSEQGVYKFELDSLTLQWSALSSIQTFEPVIAGNTLLVGSTQGLYALDKDTGKIIWHVETESTMFSPVVFKNHLYAGSLAGLLYDISLNDGSTNWTLQFDGWVYSPVVVPELHKLWTGGQAHEAVAIDMHKGTLMKRIPLTQEVIFSPVTINSQLVGYNLFNGSSVLIDVSRESISRVIEGSSQARSLLPAGNNEIYRSSRDGTLAAFFSHSEKVNWQRKFFDSGLSLYPALKNRFLLSDEDQWLVLFDSQQKQILWKQKMQGNWFLPAQLNHQNILVFFRDRMNLNNPTAVILDTTHNK